MVCFKGKKNHPLQSMEQAPALKLCPSWSRNKPGERDRPHYHASTEGEKVLFSTQVAASGSRTTRLRNKGSLGSYFITTAFLLPLYLSCEISSGLFTVSRPFPITCAEAGSGLQKATVAAKVLARVQLLPCPVSMHQPPGDSNINKAYKSRVWV